MDDQTYTVGDTVTVVLPLATGGNGTLSYSLEPPVPGLLFDSDTRTLSGVPTIADTYHMTYQVVDADDNIADSDVANSAFDITILNPEGILSTYRGSGDQIFFLNPTEEPIDGALYTLVLANASAQVYLITTNTTVDALAPRIERLDTTEAAIAPMAGADHKSRSVSVSMLNRATPHGIQYDLPRHALGDSGTYSLQPRRAVSVDDRFTFHNVTSDPTEEYEVVGTLNNGRSYFVAIPATARKVVTDGTMTFAVWVADEIWGSCSQCVRQEMVDAAANRFLRPGSGNDIHDWVTAIFGDPWGPHDVPELIHAEYADEIHLLVATTESNFNPVHNRRRVPDHNVSRFSNERLMFTMHPGLLVHADGPTWEVTDRGPSWFIGSALAHEYQHIIHYYQKLVRHQMEFGPDYQWFQEMCSMVVEDLIADKVMLGDGPRQVAYDDPTAGPTPNYGLLALYNYHNDWQASTWAGLRTHYAINYALGAYLARTYGLSLFRDMVQNDQSGIYAIEAALRTQGHTMSFGEVLQDWAVANLLSDNPSAPHPHRYNSGTWFTSQVGGETFRLGSINLFNYRYYGENDYLDGPRFYSLSQFAGMGPQPPHSNRYIALGRDSGTVRLRVTAAPGNRITVVVKE